MLVGDSEQICLAFINGLCCKIRRGAPLDTLERTLMRMACNWRLNCSAYQESRTKDRNMNGALIMI